VLLPTPEQDRILNEICDEIVAAMEVWKTLVFLRI
jgi:hypothetical protein